MRITTVDAFAAAAFQGNPAAVCVLDAVRPDAWLQDVAREMNLSETAFVRPLAEGFELRWFTPAVEVDLCGHATLAAAHVLWEEGHLPRERPALFHTRSGVLRAEPAGDAIALDFPSSPPVATPMPAGLEDALGAAVGWSGRSRFDVLAELADEATVRGLRPDIAALGRIDARGIIVTAAAASGDDGYDFVSRFFAPAVGVAEDPVTGSAHCCLGPYWAAKLGRTDVVGYQASARGGTVRVRVHGDRVSLIGHAVTVLRAELVASGG